MIEWAQGWVTPTWTMFWIAITRLGDEMFYTMFIPMVYWMMNKRLGVRLGALFLSSVLVNYTVKEWLHLPRPFEVEASVQALHADPIPHGFPSGHAQASLTMWGFLMSRWASRWLWALGITLVVLISFSRIYLGLHYPTDIVGGLAFGLVMLWAFNRLDGPLTEKALGWSLRTRLGFATIVGLLPLTVYYVQDVFKLSGFLVGLLVGYTLEREWVGFTARAPWTQQLAKMVVGFGILMALRSLTGAVFPDGILQLIRYAVLGLWIAWLAPAVFVRAGWAAGVRVADQAPVVRM